MQGHDVTYMIEYDMISKFQTHRKQKENINSKKVVFIKLKKKINATSPN